VIGTFSVTLSKASSSLLPTSTTLNPVVPAVINVSSASLDKFESASIESSCRKLITSSFATSSPSGKPCESSAFTVFSTGGSSVLSGPISVLSASVESSCLTLAISPFAKSSPSDNSRESSALTTLPSGGSCALSDLTISLSSLPFQFILRNPTNCIPPVGLILFSDGWLLLFPAFPVLFIFSPLFVPPVLLEEVVTEEGDVTIVPEVVNSTDNPLDMAVWFPLRLLERKPGIKNLRLCEFPGEEPAPSLLPNPLFPLPSVLLLLLLLLFSTTSLLLPSSSLSSKQR